MKSVLFSLLLFPVAALANNFPLTLDCSPSLGGAFQLEMTAIDHGTMVVPQQDGPTNRLVLTKLAGGSDSVSTTLSHNITADSWIGVSFTNSELLNLAVGQKIELQLIETDPGQGPSKMPADCIRSN